MEQDLENVVKYSSSVDVEMKKYRCNMCEYSTSHKGHFRDHFKKHNGEKSFKCNQCDYASVRASSLKEHLIAHSGEKAHKCGQCDFASVWAGALREGVKKSGYFTVRLTVSIYPPSPTVSFL